MPVQTCSMDLGLTFQKANSEISFQCKDVQGDACQVTTYDRNDGSNNVVIYSYVINGTPFSTSDTMGPERRHVAVIACANGKSLAFYVDVILKSVDNPPGIGNRLFAK